MPPFKMDFLDAVTPLKGAALPFAEGGQAGDTTTVHVDMIK